MYVCMYSMYVLDVCIYVWAEIPSISPGSTIECVTCSFNPKSIFVWPQVLIKSMMDSGQNNLTVDLGNS